MYLCLIAAFLKASDICLLLIHLEMFKIGYTSPLTLLPY
jgi:hypothetical protein